MLISFKVEKLVVSAIPDLVETWTKGFGFITVDDIERQRLNKINLMGFPLTILNTDFNFNGIVDVFSFDLDLILSFK